MLAIRGICNNWLTKGLDGQVAMGQVTSELLITSFEDPQGLEISGDFPPEDIAAFKRQWQAMADSGMAMVAVQADSHAQEIQDLHAEIARLNGERIDHDAAEWRSQASHDVLVERRRQVEVEDFDAIHDDMATKGQMASAAGCYALHAYDGALPRPFSAPALWPWDSAWFKLSTDPRRNLVKAGALILAEIERLDRAAAAKPAELYTAADEARMDVVGQNGPTGEHYGELPDGLSWDDAPEWAHSFGETGIYRHKVWFNDENYQYSSGGFMFTFGDEKNFARNRSDVSLIATRPPKADRTASAGEEVL